MHIRFYKDDGAYLIAEVTELYDSFKLRKNNKRMQTTKKKKTSVKAYMENQADITKAIEVKKVEVMLPILQTFAELADELVKGNLSAVSLKEFKGKLNLSWCVGNTKDADNWSSITGLSLFNVCDEFVQIELNEE